MILGNMETWLYATKVLSVEESLRKLVKKKMKIG